MWDYHGVDLFERTVSAKGKGRETLRLSEELVETISDELLADPAFRELVSKYAERVIAATEGPVEGETELRAAILPRIEEALRRHDSRFQVFASGILEVLFEKSDRGI
jgi:hypothetical protein